MDTAHTHHKMPYFPIIKLFNFITTEIPEPETTTEMDEIDVTELDSTTFGDFTTEEDEDDRWVTSDPKNPPTFPPFPHSTTDESEEMTTRDGERHRTSDPNPPSFPPLSTTTHLTPSVSQGKI